MQRTKTLLVSALLTLGAVVTPAIAQNYADGIEYYKSGQPDRAKIILERTLNDSETKQAESYYYLGEIAFPTSKDSAMMYFEKGIAADPEFALNYIGKGKVIMGKPAANDEKSVKAAIKAGEKELKAALKIKGAKKDPAVALAYVEAYYDNNLPYQEAVDRFYEKLLADYAPYYVFLGDIEAQKEEWGEACKNYELAFQWYDTTCVEAYIKFAGIYFRINPDIAIDNVLRLLQMRPNSAIAQRELAESYYRADKFNEAVQAYETYMQNPTAFQTDRPRYAALLYYDKQYEKSLALSEELLETFPDNIMLKRLVMYNTYELKDYVSAIKAAEDLFSTPNATFNSRDYVQYGKLLLALGQHDKAIEALEKAVEIDPTRLELYKELMTGLQKAGNYMRRAEVQDLYVKQLAAVEQDKTQDYFIAGRYYYMAAARAYQANDTTTTRIAAEKADSCFAIVVEKAPEDYRGHLWRASSTALLDPERKTGIAIPFYEKAIEVILQDLNNTETPPTEAVANRLKKDLIEAYTYMANFEYMAEYNKYLALPDDQKGTFKFTNTIEWCNKILKVDPNHAATKEFLNIISQ